MTKKSRLPRKLKKKRKKRREKMLLYFYKAGLEAGKRFRNKQRELPLTEFLQEYPLTPEECFTWNIQGKQNKQN